MDKNLLTAAFSNTQMPDNRLMSQLSFLFELERLKSQLRGTLTLAEKDGSIWRQENSAEHSWHLAIFALILAEYANEPINPLHVCKMLLVHDVVEIDAGDNYVYGNVDAGAVLSKEQAAAERIFGLLPPDQCDEFKSLWVEFEDGKTAEARFARALDRVHPILINYLSGGQGWQRNNIPYEKVLGHQQRVEAGSTALWNIVKTCLEYARDQKFFTAAPIQDKTP